MLKGVKRKEFKYKSNLIIKLTDDFLSNELKKSKLKKRKFKI